MKETRVFIALLMVLIGSGMAQAAKITVCNSGCDATNLAQANGLALDGDIISLQNDLHVENMQVINKAVTVEGGKRIITVNLSSTPQGSLEDVALKLNGNITLNNLSFLLTARQSGIIRTENMRNVEWNNIYMKGDNNYVWGTYGDIFSGLQLTQTTHITINNFTTYNIFIPVWVSTSDTIFNKVNFTADRFSSQGEGFSYGAMAFFGSNVSVNDFVISGYTTAVSLGQFQKAGSVSTYNITLKKGDVKNNRFGVRGGSFNLTVTDSVFDDSAVDITTWGDNNYTFRNNSIKAGVILPSGQILSLSVYSFPNITILSKNYSLVNGFDITASCSSGANCTVRFYYNTSLVTNLNLNVSTFRVWHITDPVNNTGEWLAITGYNATEGWVEISTGTFSPFYLVAEQETIPEAPPTPTPSTPTSSSGGGGGSSGGSSGGGSGGGTAPSPEAFNNIAHMGKVELYWSAGKQAVHVYKDLDISSVAIIPSKSPGYIEVRVEELKQKSNLTKTEPATEGGKLYKYYNIWLGTTGMASVQSAVIKFKAPLIDGKATKAVMMRYDDKAQAWESLETVLESSDAQFAYYSAKTAKFSPFVIIYGLPMSGGGVTETTPKATPNIVMTVRQDTPKPVQETPKATSGFELVGALVATATVFIRAKRIRKNK